jgi:transposase, IS605 orfB family
MKTVLDSLCDYRRYCWNQGLELWNTLYEARLIGLPVELQVKIKASLTDKTIEFSEEEQILRALFPAPNERKVRDELVAQKTEWELALSPRVLQLAIKDLASAWNLFFNNPKTANKPGFQSRKKPKQGFKTDQARIKDGRLVLDRPQKYKGEWMGIRFKGASIPDGNLKLCAITRTKGKYIATITMDVETVALPKTGKKTAVDANVDHFDTTDGQTSLKPELLDRLYARVRTYQRQLARKRKVNKNYRNSKGYRATRAKLQATYERIRNVQNDLLHKFTTDLYHQNDIVVIEDLDVKGMQMKKKAKNLHRSLFGRFRQFMEYKTEKFGKTLIIADRFYPSTQRCSNCGHVKTGDEKITLSGNKKHGTKHHEYVCYNCGYEDDRDHNAVLNLLALAK